MRRYVEGTEPRPWLLCHKEIDFSYEAEDFTKNVQLLCVMNRSRVFGVCSSSQILRPVASP